MIKYEQLIGEDIGNLLLSVNNQVEYWANRGVDIRIINVIKNDKTDSYVAIIERTSKI